MGARIGDVVPARQATQPDRIGSLESTLGFLKSLKIQAQECSTVNRVVDRLLMGARNRDVVPAR
jgi:hypothetical protein